MVTEDFSLVNPVLTKQFVVVIEVGKFVEWVRQVPEGLQFYRF